MKHSFRILPSIGATVLIALLSFAGTNPAHADDRLVSSNPAANESVPEIPTEIVLEFSGNLMVIDDGLPNESSAITVTNEQGETVSTGDLRIEGRVASRPLLPNLANGVYTVVWDVTSSDGHPISDSFQFSIGVPLAEAVPSEPVTPEDEVTALYDEAFVAAFEVENALRIALIVLAGAGAVAGIVGVIVVLKRRKHSLTSPE